MLHAIELLLHSELFVYHDARMVNIMMVDAQEVSYPRDQFNPRLTRRTPIPMSYTFYTTLFNVMVIVIQACSDRTGSGRSYYRH